MEGVSGAVAPAPAKNNQSKRQLGILLRHFYFNTLLLKMSSEVPKPIGV